MPSGGFSIIISVAYSLIWEVYLLTEARKLIAHRIDFSTQGKPSESIDRNGARHPGLDLFDPAFVNLGPNSHQSVRQANDGLPFPDLFAFLN